MNNMKDNKGNRSKISVDKRVFNKSIPPATTNFQKETRKGIPILSDQDVEIAREFDQENQK